MMIGYLIKYRNDCPNETLRNQYYYAKAQGQSLRRVILYLTFNAAKRSLKLAPLGKYAKIIEVDLYPKQEFIPSEHFFLTSKEIKGKKLYIPPRSTSQYPD